MKKFYLKLFCFFSIIWYLPSFQYYFISIIDKITEEENIYIVNSFKGEINTYSTVIGIILTYIIITFMLYIISKKYNYCKVYVKEEKFFLYTVYFILYNLFFSLLYSNLVVFFKQNKPEEVMNFNLQYLIINLVSSLILAPVFEELIFRKFLINILRYKFSKKWCILISAIVFAISHDSIQWIPTFIGGIILSYFYYKFNSIKFCIFLHFINNLFAVLESLLFKSNNYVMIVFNFCLFLFSILVIIHEKRKISKESNNKNLN